MAFKNGTLSIDSENIFPIIKKWLYSDQDIFYRELVSNGCDAITKLKKLEMMGEYEFPEGYSARIDVKVNPEEKTIQVCDNGLGMTAEEVEEYINKIAFSGATDFIEKYKDKANDDQIIGHFGLGFYSAFMVAENVEIDTLSYKEGAAAVHWSCDGGTDYQMDDGQRSEVGTTVTLHLSEDCLKYCNEYEARSVLKKYCSFMPVKIWLSRENETGTETILKSELLDGEEILEEVKKDKEEDPDKVKVRKRPELVNETHPLWTKNANDCTKEDYLAFYRKVFNDYKEPLFWIHLNMDYPFNLKGILYFPKINMEYDSIEGTIKLYNNQVFIADNIKEVIPEFLLLLKGVIDCPDLPLNVSRSALQNDGFVNKISDFITKKVADKLSGMCKTDKENYEKYWDDIAPFIKYGCLRDDKFCQKMTDYILFKNLDGEYQTLPECLEVAKTDIEEEEGEEKKEENSTEDAVKEETEAPEEKEEGEKEEEKKEKVIYYVTDEKQQSQYINMFKKAKLTAVILNHNIDQPFINQLESKNEGIRFRRIDADLGDPFKAKTSKKEEEELAKTAEGLEKKMRKALKKDKLSVKLEKLKNKKISSVLTVSEESRRMQDMMKMYSMNGLSGMADMGAEETLILNANHPLVSYIMEHEESEDSQLVCEQLYDLAKVANAPLSPEEMTKFVERSNLILQKVFS